MMTGIYLQYLGKLILEDGLLFWERICSEGILGLEENLFGELSSEEL